MANQGLSLSQDLRLQMILAPQLRQSLELLQVPALELRTLIQQELEQNPTLEEQMMDAVQIEVEEKAGEVADDKELEFSEEFEVLARLDDEWSSYFMQDQDNEPYDSSRQRKRDFFFDSLVQKLSLQDHLLNQLMLSELSDADKQLGELVIGTINDDGYLLQDIDALAESTGADATHMHDILGTIQEMDPVGIGARDLKECLMLQLERLGHQDSLAAQIVQDHLDKLGHKKYKEIAQATKVPLENVQQAAKLIATLEPKPGRMFSAESPTYVMPDVVVRKVDGKYVVIVNDDQIPQLRISRHYRTLMKDKGATGDVKDYIRERIRAGLFLIKSISQRQQTLFNVASRIVEVQNDFLDQGVTGLKPLTMVEVANVVGIHETTVCRAIANKYMQTPQGLFEMKYFFTPGLRTSDGRNVSNRSVKEMISTMVDNEDCEHPLSDQEIVKRLNEQGLKVARRTVAKYRLELKIPPSHLRKSF